MALRSPSGTYELDSLPKQGDPSFFSPDAFQDPNDKLLSNHRNSKSPQNYVPSIGKSKVATASHIFKTLLLPLIAVAYLAFCYTVRFKTIPVRTRLVDDSPENIAIIKSGVTSISIILITIALVPIYSVIADLKGEEFFRAISSNPSGSPLASVNSISSPSFGLLDSLIVLLSRHCSPYFLVAFTSGFLALVASALAPAALSVSTALFDSDVMAFAVGAIKRDDVLNATVLFPDFTLKAYHLYDKASNLAWVENDLGVPYSYQVHNPERYIVPPPIDLPMDIPARWLSDVVVMDPVCRWNPAHINSTFASITNRLTYLINLDGEDLDVTLAPQNAFFGGAYLDVSNSILSNHTDTGFPLSGTTVWTMAQCVSNCTGFSFTQVDFNLTGIPYIDIAIPNTVDNSTAHFAVGFLVCNPNPRIETREVRSDGHGRLTVLDNAYPFPQGNLFPAQTQIMLSQALLKFSESAGPRSAGTEMGSESQAVFVFGQAAANFTSDSFGAVLMTPQPIENITASYARILQSVSKAFIGGTMSTAYVPGRLSKEQVIFTSSLPQTIASTVLFVLLSVVVALAHFRQEIPKFTLFSVAASLYRSDIPTMFAQVKGDADSGEKEAGMVATFGGRCIVLAKSDANLDTLALR